LDIELSNEKVFDYLSIFSKKPQLIFISSDINSAIKAIKAGAKDYLLKPLQEIEFSIAIQNAVNVCKQKNDSIHSLPIEKYIIENGQSIFYVSLKNIVYLKSINNYTEIHFDDGKSILTSKTLKHYSEFFTPEIFMRIHHSYLINLHHLRQIENQGDLKVVLTNDIVLPISSRKKNIIFNQLKRSTQM
jgi:two-component system LytT family response regulator